MVVGKLDAEQRTDLVFGALADATRRDIVRRAMDGDHSVSSLARLYPMSFAAVQKHVAVLERSGLVTKERRGREQLVRTNVDAIRHARTCSTSSSSCGATASTDSTASSQTKPD